jgi:hypothetical protein
VLLLLPFSFSFYPQFTLKKGKFGNLHNLFCAFSSYKSSEFLVFHNPNCIKLSTIPTGFSTTNNLFSPFDGYFISFFMQNQLFEMNIFLYNPTFPQDCGKVLWKTRYIKKLSISPKMLFLSKSS